MKNKKKLHTLFLLVVLCSFLAGCSTEPPTPTVLDGATKEAVLAYSEAKTDGLLTGLKANDYAMFAKDFDADMQKAIPQSDFSDFKDDRDTKVGAYISRQVNRVLQQGDFYAVIYDAQFEKEKAVTIRVVFRIAAPHQISGLWFDK